MRINKRVFIVTVAAAFGVASISTPVMAGSGTGTTANLSVTYNASAVAFDGPGCVESPVSVTYNKTGAVADDISGTVELAARYDGSSSSATRDTYIGYSLPSSGTVSDSYLFICPFEIFDNAGPMRVTGTVESDVNFSQKSVAPVTESILDIVQNPTKLSKAKVKNTSGYVSYREISGTAKAQTISKGLVGAGGTLTLEIKKKGAKRWTSIETTSADEFGNWEFGYVTTSKSPRGSAFRVTLTECGWCSTAVTTGVIR